MRTLNTTVREETRGPTQNTSLDLRHQEDLRETTNSTYSAPSQILTGTPREQGEQQPSPRPYLYSPTRLPNTHTHTPQVRHRQHTPNLLLSPFQDVNRAAASAGFPLADSVSRSHPDMPTASHTTPTTHHHHAQEDHQISSRQSSHWHVNSRIRAIHHAYPDPFTAVHTHRSQPRPYLRAPLVLFCSVKRANVFADHPHTHTPHQRHYHIHHVHNVKADGPVRLKPPLSCSLRGSRGTRDVDPCPTRLVIA